MGLPMWTEFLDNATGIEAVYSGTPPRLESVRIHEVVLAVESSALKFRIDLPEYPVKPPKKWAAHGYNTVQVELYFSGVRDVELSGFCHEIVGDVVLSGGEVINVEVNSESMRIRATADMVFVSNISAYTDAC
ncbi:Imm50 family immunity protein [Streptomyces sp. NPDC051162]|uniref:Imm50 family immunity protein n=1 Tax=Streptomyces sp. NPDC051162 TaxID=3154747 RepID=UPI00343F35E9